MKPFVKLLLEERIVSAAQLVEALLFQGQGAPSLVELASRDKLLSPEQVFELLLLLAEGDLGFRGACQKLGYWTETFASEMQTRVEASCQPITRILVDRGLVNYQTLNDALDRYLAQATIKPAPSAVAPVQVTTPIPEVPLTAPVSGAPATESLGINDLLSEAALNELQTENDKLKSAIGLGNNESVRETASALFHNVHRFTGILTLSDKPKLSALSTQLETRLQNEDLSTMPQTTAEVAQYIEQLRTELNPNLAAGIPNG